jgi:hypothetical protein
MFPVMALSLSPRFLSRLFRLYQKKIVCQVFSSAINVLGKHFSGRL